MTETAPAAPRMRDYLPVVFNAVCLVAVIVTSAVFIPRISADTASIRESASTIDAVLISATLQQPAYLPTTVTTDKDGTLRFDGETVLDVDGHPITLLDNKSVTGYMNTGRGYRFCVVDKHGPWALADSTYAETITSGTDDQACTR